MTKIRFILTIAIPFLLFPTITSAAGIQVSPGRLDFAVSPNKEQVKTLTVANPTKDAQVYQIYPDDFPSQITADPQSFTLEAGAQRTVKIAVKAGSKLNDKILTTNISTVSRPLADGKFSVGTGVKIPITITVLPLLPQTLTKQMVVAAALVLFVLLLAAAFLIRRARKTKIPKTA